MQNSVLYSTVYIKRVKENIYVFVWMCIKASWDIPKKLTTLVDHGELGGRGEGRLHCTLFCISYIFIYVNVLLNQSKCKKNETTMGNKKRWHQCEMNFEGYEEARKPMHLDQQRNQSRKHGNSRNQREVWVFPRMNQSESWSAKSKGRLRGNRYGNSLAAVQTAGTDGPFSPSLPSPMDPLSEAIFGLCPQAKVAWRGL